MGKKYKASRKKRGGQGRADKKSSYQSGNLIQEKPKGKTAQIVAGSNGTVFGDSGGLKKTNRLPVLLPDQSRDGKSRCGKVWPDSKVIANWVIQKGVNKWMIW